MRIKNWESKGIKIRIARSYLPTPFPDETIAIFSYSALPLTFLY